MEPIIAAVLLIWNKKFKDFFKKYVDGYRSN